MTRKSLISELDFQDINKRSSEGVSVKDLAADYGVSYQIMYNTIKKRIPKWVSKVVKDKEIAELQRKEEAEAYEATKEEKECNDALEAQSDTCANTLTTIADAAGAALVDAAIDKAQENMCKRYLLQRIQNLVMGSNELKAEKALEFARAAFDNYNDGDFELCIDKTLRAFHYFNVAASKVSS